MYDVGTHLKRVYNTEKLRGKKKKQQLLANKKKMLSKGLMFVSAFCPIVLFWMCS